MKLFIIIIIIFLFNKNKVHIKPFKNKNFAKIIFFSINNKFDNYFYNKYFLFINK